MKSQWNGNDGKWHKKQNKKKKIIKKVENDGKARARVSLNKTNMAINVLGRWAECKLEWKPD